MDCPDCGADTKTIESRGGPTRRRVRECPAGHRFSTEELPRETVKLLRAAAQRATTIGAMLAELVIELRAPAEAEMPTLPVDLDLS